MAQKSEKTQRELQLQLGIGNVRTCIGFAGREKLDPNWKNLAIQNAEQGIAWLLDAGVAVDVTDRLYDELEEVR